MKNTELIEFKRERELGEVLSDTFTFIRQNYKSLLQVIYKIMGPVFFLVLLSFVVYFVVAHKQLDSILEDAMSGFGNAVFGFSFLAGSLSFGLVSVLFYAVFYAALNYSVQSYIEHDGEIRVEEVKAKVWETWLSFLGMALLAGMVIFIGILCCFVPGIYLYVPMSLVFSIMVFHRMSIGESFSYSFKLIKANWWNSFLTLFVMGLIFYLSSSIFQLPATIYTLIKTMTVSRETGFEINAFSAGDIPYLLLNLIGTLAQFILYGIVIISTIFIYFSLNEKLNQTGAFEMIDQLGEE